MPVHVYTLVGSRMFSYQDVFSAVISSPINRIQNLGDNCIATELTKYRIIDISTLCDVIFDCSDIWSTNFGDSKIKYNYVFDRRNHKDMSLYNKLCDEERIDYSKE